MSTPVHTISELASVEEAEECIRTLGITSLAVLDERGRCAGVVSGTDLIADGLRNAGLRQDAALLEVGSKKVADVMTRDLVSADIATSMAEAARLMVQAKVHRIFVMARSDVAGIVSTRDIMAAVEQARVNKPVSQFMSTPVFTVRASEPISLATERLEKARVTGLIVVDESGWPVGVYGQEEALDAGNAERKMSVEEVMNPCVLTLHSRCAIHLVARQALAMGARRVAVMSDRELVGIMTGVDFAKAIS